MKIFTRLTIWTLVIITAFASLFLVSPKNALAAAGGTTDYGDYIPPISYQQTAEQKYIYDYLILKKVSGLTALDILRFLDSKAYFSSMTATQKNAFLLANFRQKRLYFWQKLPLVIQVEESNKWATGPQYHTIDMSYKTCYGDNVSKKLNDALILFATSYCQADIKGVKSNFFDKQKWQSTALDELYYKYWPDLANFRYRPAFNDQEISRLSAFYSRSGSLGINCNGGYKPPATKVETLSMLDMAIMLIAPEELTLAKGAEIAVGGKKILSEISELKGRLIGSGPSPSGKIELNTKLLNQIYRRWRNSGLPVDDWFAAETKFQQFWTDTLQRGKLIKLPSSKVLYLMENTEYVSTLPSDVGGIAHGIDASGKIISPMQINNIYHKPASMVVNLNPAEVLRFRITIAHETNHYLFVTGGGKYFYDPVAAAAYRSQGFTDSGAGPLNEVITDFLSRFNEGLIARPRQYGNIAYPKQYYDTVESIISKIMKVKRLNREQSIQYLFDSYSNGKLFDVFKTIFPNDPYGGVRSYAQINDALANGNFVQIKNIFRK